MITQQEADGLLAMKKIVLSRKSMVVPLRGKESWDLESIDTSEKFQIDFWCGRIEMMKYNTNHRCRKDIVLARVCVNNKPHMNPDGTILDTPHLHIYKEGFGDKYAIPLPQDLFTNPDDIVHTMQDFLAYCNVVDHPKVQQQGGLFP